MEFRLDESQIGLQETVARFCTDRFPLDGLQAREGAGIDRATWREMAELGVFALLLDEDDGGSGLGAVEGAIVFEQLGSHLVSGPLLWTLLAAPLVPGAATGAAVIGGVDGTAVDAGTALVEHGSGLDAVLVVHLDRVELFDARALATPTALDPLDPLTPVSRVDGLVGGQVVGGAAEAIRMRDLGTVLVSAMLAGIAARSLEVARAYALERRQFDAPIGSFQAVKHILADMYVRSGLAQSSSYAAAAVLQDPGEDDPSAAASAAKVVGADAAIANAGAAVQVLGGMGFTWEMLPNHLLKRAWVLEQTLGTADDHAGSMGTKLVEAHR